MYHNGSSKVKAEAAKESEESSEGSTILGKLQMSDVERPQGRIEINGEEFKDFLNSVTPNWCKPLHPRNLQLEEAMTRIFEAEVERGVLTNEEMKSLRKRIPNFCETAEEAYFDFPFEVKLLIAMYTAVFLLVDDMCGEEPERRLPELQRFIRNWGDNSRAHEFHSHFNHWYRLATVEVPKYFGPVATANIIHASMGFMIGTMLESQYPDGLNCPRTSSRYPAYVRRKSGVSEAFTHFLFPTVRFPEEEYLETYLPTIPDVQLFTDRLNDLLSFYKESVVGNEENTFIKTMSRLRECSPLDVWGDSFKQMPTLVREISATLSRREELLKPWEQFRDGYIRWHVWSARYRLSEIGVTCEDQ